MASRGGAPHESPHREETLQLFLLPRKLCSELKFDLTQERNRSHAQSAKLPGLLTPVRTHETALWGETVRLLRVWKTVHPAGKFEGTLVGSQRQHREKPFSCSVYGKTRARLENLKRHSGVHVDVTRESVTSAEGNEAASRPEIFQRTEQV